MPDYIPAPDGNFNAWQTNFVAYCTANTVALGLTPADITALAGVQTPWGTAFPAHVAAASAAKAAKQAKDEARRNFVAVIRPLVRRLQASASVSDAERAALGITVPSNPGHIGAPTTRPLVAVECGQRLQHTLRFADEATPTRRAKPEGVMGCEIWRKVGATPPSGQGELQFVAVDTSSPHIVSFESEDGGKTAYYWTRWVSPTGERGPWSETAAATVAA